MEFGGRVLKPASTNFDDYVGTVAADDAEAVLDRPSLYELAQIDRDRYTIVAVDLEVDGPVTAIIYAIDRVAHHVSAPAEVIELAQRKGGIPVVDFQLPQATVEEFIQHAFKRISVRLVTRHLRDQVLIVTGSSATPDLSS
jgi:hypothetical protein